MLSLEVIAGPGVGKVYPIPVGQLAVDIGRSSTCTVFLYSPTVAKHHLRLAARGDRYLPCLDVDHGYETKLNGLNVAAPFGIVPGDEIQVGEVTLRLRTDDEIP